MLGQAPKTEATAGGAAVPQPRAELSDLAANALAPSSAPMNAEKVAALRTAIADGSYKVDPEAIAARMIDLDLGRAQ